MGALHTRWSKRRLQERGKEWTILTVGVGIDAPNNATISLTITAASNSGEDGVPSHRR